MKIVLTKTGIAARRRMRKHFWIWYKWPERAWRKSSGK